MTRAIWQANDVVAAIESAAATFEIAGAVVLIAVSGGPDSIALLHAVHANQRRLEIGGLAAAHFDHGLRGEQSAAEADFVAHFCSARGIPCFVETASPGLLDSSHGGSLQDAARKARYEFLNRIADRLDARFIATAHNQGDQIETILINILRGAGIEGLRGIPQQNGRVVRPLLTVPRAAIEAYCAEHGLDPRRDPTNDDPSHYLRNRIRLELLPLLERDYHSGVADVLLRLARNASIDADYLEAQARAAFEKVVDNDAVEIDVLLALPEALRRRVVRLAIERARGSREGLEERHVDLALTLATGRRSAGFTIPAPACRVRRTGTRLVFERLKPVARLAAYSVPLAVDNTVDLPNGWTISAFAKSLPVVEGAYSATLDAHGIDLETLTVRRRAIGDRIDPLGMGGKTKKLQDLFVDAKIPRAHRDDWPIIADSAGPLWIPGITQSERAKITEDTSRTIWLFALVTTRAAIDARHSP